jgi:hypothetical protein
VEACVTQVQHETVDQQAEAVWREFAAWLTSKRLILSALALIAAQVALNSYVLNRGFFQADDFAIGGLAAHSFSVHLLFQNYAGHLMPAVFALAWLLTHSGGGYDWGLWAGSLVVLQALAALALLRALRTLIGDRMVLLVPLGVFLFTPMALADLSWWAVGIQSVPIQLALALAVDQHVRYVRSGRMLHAVCAVAWVVFGLAFFEKSVAIPLLLFALTSAFLEPGNWAQGMRTTLRRHWPAWALYAGAVIAELVAYAISLRGSTVRVQVPEANTFVAFGWDLLRNTFAPSAVGGPWRWTPAGVSTSWSLYSLASPPLILLALSWALGALVVLASLWYRREAWRAWTILLGWLVVADIAPVALGRVVVFGTLLSAQTSYVADAAPVLAICLAVAFLPLRGEERAYRTRLRAGRPRRAALAGAAAVTAAFLTGSVWSASAYRDELHPQNSRSYLATVSAALADAPRGAVIYTSQIPSQMAWTLLGQPTDVENALAPLADRVIGRNFRWLSRPVGKIINFMVFDAQGRLHPAVVIGPHTNPFARQSQCVLTAHGMQLPLTAAVYPLPLLMQVGYYADRPVTLAVTLGGSRYLLTLPASQLAYAYLPVQGPGNIVGITPVTPHPEICIGTVTVGNVQAAASGTPIPAFPARG